MINNLKQIIKEELIKLPKESQEVINNFGWEKTSEEISKMYSFNEDQINKLQAEIFMVMSGIIEEELFPLHIENRIGTSKGEAKKIAEEINQKIFIPMLEKRDKLIKEALQTQKQSWDKTINFIISGGDYSVFIEK